MHAHNAGFAKGKFDFILTNPPFGSKIAAAERPYLGSYTLGNSYDKKDNAFNVEYYDAERTTIIDTIKTVPHKRIGDCAYFMSDLASATDDWYLGLAGVQSNTGELSGADDEATGQAFSFHENDVLYCRLRPYLNKVWKAERGGNAIAAYSAANAPYDDRKHAPAQWE
jgi:hypothetical protein